MSTSNSIRVCDVMTRPSPFVRQHAPLGEVVETLLSNNVMGLPVLDDHDRVVGFVSEQDCIHSMLVSSYHCEGAPNVDDVMHNEVLSVEPEQSIVDLAQIMGKNKPKLYPVIDDGRLVGLITRSAILSALWESRTHCDAQ
ncbi:CBS domain-containing protein [Spongiibacter sp.]|uniref:CBS domain-containing protein n=1 Tax=Spongiibacter sp. TaxID=2024860 RepID=UPI0035656F51